MSKINVSYRLEDFTVTRLQKLVEYYSENVRRDLVLGRKSKLSKTDVLDYLINKAYEEMEKEEEENWEKRNVNKLS
jgi:hypothetical protein